jgi:hypothetical protein
MSVEISRDEAVCVLRFSLPVTAADVDAVAQALQAVPRAAGQSLAVLAVMRGKIARPDAEARSVMRTHRELLRSCDEAHVVVVDAGLIAKLSIGLLGPSQLLARRKPAVFLHRTEARARRALRDAGFLR